MSNNRTTGTTVQPPDDNAWIDQDPVDREVRELADHIAADMAKNMADLVGKPFEKAKELLGDTIVLRVSYLPDEIAYTVECEKDGRVLSIGRFPYLEP